MKILISFLTAFRKNYMLKSYIRKIWKLLLIEYKEPTVLSTKKSRFSDWGKVKCPYRCVTNMFQILILSEHHEQVNYIRFVKKTCIVCLLCFNAFIFFFFNYFVLLISWVHIRLQYMQSYL